MLRLFNKQLIQTTLLVPLAFGIQYLIELEIARRVGPVEFGVFSLMASVAATVTPIVLLGVPLTFPALSSWPRDHVGVALTITAILTLAVSPVIFSFWFWWQHSALDALAITVGFVGTSLWLVRRHLGVAAQYLIPGVFGPRELVVLPLVLVMLLLLDVVSGLTIFLVFAVSLLALEAIALIAVLRHSFTDLNIERGLRKSAAAVISRGLGFLKNTIGNLAFMRADILLVAPFLDTVQLGNYALASRASLIGTVAIRALEVHFSPRMAKSFAEAGSAGARSELASAVPVSILMSLGLLIPAIGGLVLITNTMFEEYQVVQLPALVLVTSHLIATALMPYGTFLSMTGRHHLRGNITLLFAALLVPALIAATVIGGVLGAAVAVAGAIVGMRIATAYYAVRSNDYTHTAT